MKNKDNNPTWEIHPSYEQFKEISRKFRLLGVCSALHTQCAAPVHNYTGQFLLVRRASPVRCTTYFVHHAFYRRLLEAFLVSKLGTG